MTTATTETNGAAPASTKRTRSKPKEVAQNHLDAINGRLAELRLLADGWSEKLELALATAADNFGSAAAALAELPADVKRKRTTNLTEGASVQPKQKYAERYTRLKAPFTVTYVTDADPEIEVNDADGKVAVLKKSHVELVPAAQ
jgi:hypothetical protein